MKYNVPKKYRCKSKKCIYHKLGFSDSKEKEKHELNIHGNSLDKEKPAKGTRGFLMTPVFEGDKDLYFRIYHKDKKGQPGFTDYLVTATDIEVEIKDSSVAFKKTKKFGPILDWDSDTLGEKK